MKNAHIALLVSIFFIVQLMTPLAEFTELKEHNPSNVAAQSSWVWDVNVGIEGGQFYAKGPLKHQMLEFENARTLNGQGQPRFARTEW